MTEKRFYYNTFYHADDMSRVLNYEIIDRQSYPNYPHHDEKKDIPDWYIYITENDSGWQDILVNLLNALHEKNEQLKARVKYLERKIDRERKSNIIEHEKWEKEVIELIRKQRKMIDNFNEENEQLKKQINELQFNKAKGQQEYQKRLSE